MNSPGFFERHDAVYLYVPNLIGYFRVFCMLASFALSPSRPVLCIVVYMLGFCLDELDGRFARMLNQTSTLGAVLDMVTDRIATTGLLALLCSFAPAYQMIWLSVLALDLSSHWFQMYSSLACGNASHKDMNSTSLVIRLYYTHRLFMGFCCVSCEVLFLSLVALFHKDMPSWDLPLSGATLAWIQAATWTKEAAVPVAAGLALACVPGFVIKQVVNLFQLKTSAQVLAKADRKASKSQ